jgi:hypothetical protein
MANTNELNISRTNQALLSMPNGKISYPAYQLMAECWCFFPTI